MLFLAQSCFLILVGQSVKMLVSVSVCSALEWLLLEVFVICLAELKKRHYGRKISDAMLILKNYTS